MNITQIENILRDTFNSVESVNGSFFVCKKISGQNPYSIFYFDTKDKVPENLDSLKEYQDKLIAEQYYAQQNDLRWNSYLIFVLSKTNYDAVSSSGLKANIEHDKIYTRKHIIHENELSDFSNFFSEQYSPQGASIDLSSEWFSLLEKNGLSEILSTKRKSTVIDEILGGTRTQADIDLDQGSGNIEDIRTGYISSLTLDKYDPFPKIREHNFLDVNLIVGKNGAGKSSLLEAIEYCLCGENRRERSTDNLVTIKYRDSEAIEVSEPGNHDKYKFRDLKWYGRTILRGSDLATSFNRYNFYNTDAAFHLSEKNSEGELIDAFSALAFGDKTNVIEKKVENYRGDFEKEYSSGKDMIQLLNKQLEEVRQQLELKGKLGSLASSATEELRQYLASKPFIREKLQDNADNLDSIRLKVSEFNDELKDIKRKMFWLERVSIDSINSSEQLLRRNLSSIKDLVKKYEENKLKIVEFKKASTQIEKRITLLTLAKLFSEEEDLSGLKDLEANRKECINRARVIGGAQDVFSGLDYKQLTGLNIGVPLNDLQDNLAKQLDADSKRLGEKKLDLKRAKEKADHIQSLIIEIQVLGGQLASQKADLKDCPLCGHHHENGLQVLATSHAGSIALQAITILEKEVLEIENAIGKTTAQLRIIEATEQINSILGWSGKGQTVPLRTNLEEIVSELKNKDSYNIKLAALDGFKKRLDAKGISHAAFEKLTLDMAVEYPGTAIIHSNFNMIEKLLDKVNFEKNEVSAKLQMELSNYEQLVSIKEKLASEIGSDLGGAEDLTAEISRRLSSIESLKTGLTKLQNDHYVGVTSDLIELSNMASICSEKINDLSRLKHQENSARIEVLALNSKIDELSKDITARQQKVARAGEVLGVISSILDPNKKKGALNEVLSRNLNLINWIFGKIHAPREFSQLDPNTLKLVRESDGKKHKLDQISTGQRSALALSVFLSLNLSLTDAPPQILLDDPVAHVDDLNTLSFFDFLRELAVRGKRQIFFATANEKLADLFEKKFRFLGEKKFKRIDLSRNDRSA